MTPKGDKGNGRTSDRRTGVDRRIADDPSYKGPDRRLGATRRRAGRAPDKPLKR